MSRRSAGAPSPLQSAPPPECGTAGTAAGTATDPVKALDTGCAAPAAADRLVDALVAATAVARWPDGGPLLVDLAEDVIRAYLAQPLLDAWQQIHATPPERMTRASTGAQPGSALDDVTAAAATAGGVSAARTCAGATCG